MKVITDPFTAGRNPFDELEEYYGHQRRPLGDKENKAARERTMDRLMIWLRDNPMLAKYHQHTKGNLSLNTLPEHALGERLHAMSACVLAGRGYVDIVKPTTEGYAKATAEYLRDMACGLALLLTNAQVYLWSDKMEKLADAAPLPVHTVSRNVLPMPLMFWSRETRYNFEDAYGRVASNNWLALVHHTEQVFIIGDLSYHDNETTKLMINHLVYGGVWPNDYDNNGEIALMLKRCAFLASPFVVTARQRMTHTTRRQLERDAGMTREQTNEPEAHVVALRRLKFKAAQKPVGEPKDVEWKHHWWVSSFYRAQWYPSEKAHKVIWIAPHLKGDLSKPLLEKVYAVVR